MDAKGGGSSGGKERRGGGRGVRENTRRMDTCPASRRAQGQEGDQSAVPRLQSRERPVGRGNREPLGTSVV